MKLLIGLIAVVFSFSALADEISTEGLNELKFYQPLHDCYKAFLQASGSSGQKTGKLAIELKLDKTGSVLAINEIAKQSTLHSEILNSCLFQTLSNLKFPNETAGKAKLMSVTLSFPIKNPTK